MSNWTRLVQDIASEELGEMTGLHFDRSRGRCVAYLERDREVLAVAGGADHGEACRRLIQMLSRKDLTLSTQEAAEVLSVDDSRVRQLAIAGRFVPVTPGGKGGHAARFRPADVYDILVGPTRR